MLNPPKTRKLKTIPWIRVGVEGNRDSQYVDANLAQGLLEAATLALDVAESIIHDEYDGTSMLKGMLAELEPARDAILSATEEVEPESLGDFLLHAMKLQAPTEEES